jgi:hypothetical protein
VASEPPRRPRRRRERSRRLFRRWLWSLWDRRWRFAGRVTGATVAPSFTAPSASAPPRHGGSRSRLGRLRQRRAGRATPSRSPARRAHALATAEFATIRLRLLKPEARHDHPRPPSAPQIASRCYPARYAQGGGSPQCAATEEPYLRHTSLDRNRCWRHTRQWHLVMPSLPEMRVERDWRSSAARPSASGRSRGSDADRQGYGQARQDGGPDMTCRRLTHGRVRCT